MIATFVYRDRDIRAASEHAAAIRERLIQCKTKDDFLDLAGSRRVSTLLLDLSYWDAAGCTELVVALQERAQQTRLVLVHGGGIHEGELFARLARQLDGIESAYRVWCDDVRRCLECAPNAWSPPATPKLAKLLMGALLNGKEIGILVSLVAEAERKATLSKAAAAAGVNDRTVADLIWKLGFASFVDFRGFCRLMHAAFRLERGASPALTGRLAGFDDGAKGLRDYSWRTCRLSLKELAGLGFDNGVRPLLLAFRGGGFGPKPGERP